MAATPAFIPLRLQRLATWQISQANVRSHALLTDALAKAGARGYDYRILAAVAELGPSSQATLGRATSLDRSDVAGTVRHLVDRGAVTRSPDASDRRTNKITLTVSGRRWLARLDTVLAHVQDQVLAPLTHEDRAELARLLAQIQPTSAEQTDPHPGPRRRPQSAT